MSEQTGAAFEKSASEALQLTEKHTRFSWETFAINLVCVPATFGAIVLPVDDDTKAYEIPVPDDWLKAVAVLPNLSKEGLTSIAKEISRKGYVSVGFARDFINKERSRMEAAKTKAENTNKGLTQVSGAALLLARYEQEEPGAIEKLTSGIKLARNGLNSVFKAAINVSEGVNSFAKGVKFAKEMVVGKSD